MGSCQNSMLEDVFALHNIVGKDNVELPFPIRDYQRYVFGDDTLAYRFGTDLAKAFVARRSEALPHTSSAVSNNRPLENLAVAAISNQIPTATHSLRDHFVAYINRHLITVNAKPALKIDIFGTKVEEQAQLVGSNNGTKVYHIDKARLQARPLVVLGDLRLSQDQENPIKTSLRKQGVESTILFVYLLALDSSISSAAISPLLSSIIDSSPDDVLSIVQARRFKMNESFVHFVLGQENTSFYQIIRRQDDCFARMFLDYAISGQYQENTFHQQNFRFLLWEVEARETM